MKLIISTLIAAAAFTSLHANERDDYYNSLLAKTGTSTTKPVQANRDDYYNSLLANMQTSSNTPASKGESAIKKYDNGPVPSADAIYSAYPNATPQFYRYAARNHRYRDYYLGRRNY